ncbi:hypothetical protein GCM10007853_03380 [Algimonas ampicilliniresistens]|uniref:Uncharacterized protein n=1 Tax=Algimonas ampicilliniresistens TaxID=1298735 RepID=A0ABQ5V668_9PROT|nr:hypothetical protein GCM10007853_03380 [Algimonas ampicilliniresistens]
MTDIVLMPNSGNKTRGRKAVTATGIASVDHQIAIHAANAAVAVPVNDKPSGLKKRKSRMATIGPAARPMF